MRTRQVLQLGSHVVAGKRGSRRKSLPLLHPRGGSENSDVFPFPSPLPLPVLQDATRAGASAPSLVWVATAVMAMFEQMRANVGKLLKGIDRSEHDRGRASGQAGWGRGFLETARGGQDPGLALGWDFPVFLRRCLRKTALEAPRGRR